MYELKAKTSTAKWSCNLTATAHAAGRELGQAVGFNTQPPRLFTLQPLNPLSNRTYSAHRSLYLQLKCLQVKHNKIRR